MKRRPSNVGCCSVTLLATHLDQAGVPLKAPPQQSCRAAGARPLTDNEEASTELSVSTAEVEPQDQVQLQPQSILPIRSGPRHSVGGLLPGH